MKPLNLLAIIAMLSFAACKKNGSPKPPPPVPTTDITTIVYTYKSGTTTLDYDSTIFRFAAHAGREAHYSNPGDSSNRAYIYNTAAGKLTEIIDMDGIFYVNTLSGPTLNVVRMGFKYDSKGDLSEIKSEYPSHAASTAYVRYSQQNGKTVITLYDTMFADLEKRVIHYTLHANKYIEQDSTIYLAPWNQVKTRTWNYVYDNDFNVTSAFNNNYTAGGHLVTNEITTSTHYTLASPYEALHKVAFRDLASWLPYTKWFSSQNNSPYYFDLPRKLFKSSETDGWIYIFNPPTHYEATRASVIEEENSRIKKRVITISDAAVDDQTITENFYYK